MVWSKIPRGFIVPAMFPIRYPRPPLAVGVLLAAAILFISSSPTWAGHDPCIDLIEAAFMDDVDEIHDLFTRKVDVNCRDAEGQTPLMLAAEGGSVIAMRMILAWNAEVNLWDKYGQSALDRARGKLELFHMEGAEHIHMIYQGIIRMLENAGAVEKQPGEKQHGKPKKRPRPPKKTGT